MTKDQLTWFRQVTCCHAKEGEYTQRRFDILEGFELVETKCAGCHKILALRIMRIGRHEIPQTGITKRTDQ